MVKYYENKEKGTVTAVVEDCQYDAIDIILKRYPYADLMSLDDDCLIDALMNYRYSATARCHPDDEFDPEIGRKIALKKLKEKTFDARKRAIERWINRQKKLLDDVILPERKKKESF